MAINSVNMNNGQVPMVPVCNTNNCNCATNPVQNSTDKNMADMTGATILSNQIAGTIQKNRSPHIKYQADGKTPDVVTEFDPETGKKVKKTVYDKTGKIVEFVSTYDKNTGFKTSETFYNDDGSIFNNIYFNPQNGLRLKSEQYHNGKLNEIEEYSEVLAGTKPVKTTHYREDGSTIDAITLSQYNEMTGNLVKEMEYNADGKTLRNEDDFNENGKRIRSIEYDRTGNNVKEIYNSEPRTGNITQKIEFKPDGKTVDNVTIANPQIDKLEYCVYYQDDGKTVKKVIEYNNSGDKCMETDYAPDGKTVIGVKPLDPMSDEN